MPGSTDEPNSADDALARRLASMDPFAQLSREELAALTPMFEAVTIEPGGVLVEQGERADAMFVLLGGHMSVSFERGESGAQQLAELEPGSIIGELALLAGGRRSASVRATTRSHLARLDSSAFNSVLDSHPELAAKLAALSSQRLRKDQLVSQMASLFAGLEPAQLRELEAAVEWVSLQAGEVLFEHGDPGDCAYLLVSGRLFVAKREGDGAERIVGEIGRGQIVGEYAILLDEPRQATVRASRDSDLARIPRAVFEDLVDRSPKIMVELARTIIRRSSSSEVQLRSRDDERTLAVVPLDERVDADAFAEALVEELGQWGTSVRLSAERVDALLEKPGIAKSVAGEPANIRLLQWLNQLEPNHRFVVYQADRTYDHWTERAIRHADQLILVADARSSPGLREVERRPAALRKHSRQRTELVLLHPSGTERPRDTAAWLAAREVDAVHHLRRGSAADLARLGRTLSGHALGLVLGGGGARGFAHIGVIRALEQLGVPIDMVGGTSIGAPIGHLVAKRLDATRTLDIISTGFRALLDYTLPMAALLEGKRIANMINQYAADWDIEDLWLPYYCVSTDITTAREIRHRRGNLARAIRASVSIPGVLPPVPEDGHLLVDGGVINNLAIDAMREMNPTGPIIAVDVVPPQDPNTPSNFGLSVSGWKVARSRISPWQPSMTVPSAGTTILRSLLVGANQTKQRQLDAGLADLYLSIDVTEFGMLDFERVEEVAELGYQQSLGPLKRWLDEGGLERSS